MIIKGVIEFMSDRENMWNNDFHESLGYMHQLGGLRIWILQVLDDGPKNGVEIMDAVQKHTEKFHKLHPGPFGISRNTRPLPGSIYPMLKKMVSVNLIIKRDDGRYELTEEGKEINSKLLNRFNGFHEKNNNHRIWSIENILNDIDNGVSYLEDIKTEKLALHKEIIESLTERFNKLNDSIHNE